MKYGSLIKWGKREVYKKEKVVITTTHLNLLLTLKSNTMKKPIQRSVFSEKYPNKQAKKCAIQHVFILF